MIDVATRNGEWPRQPTPALRAFPNAWLRELLQRSIRGIGDLPEQSEGVDTRRAEGTLLALMQVGRDLTVAAAATLLRHDWVGAAKLVRFFWLWAEGLEPDARDDWVRRLNPPDAVGELKG